MNTPRITPTTVPDLAAWPPVADRVAAATEECQRQFTRLIATRPSTDAEHAERAEKLAILCARAAGWWRVLTSGTRCDASLHRVFRDAVIAAECQERGQARFWRDAAAEWRARAEQRPTSDAAGALSNWYELGVSA